MDSNTLFYQCISVPTELLPGLNYDLLSSSVQPFYKLYNFQVLHRPLQKTNKCRNIQHNTFGSSLLPHIQVVEAGQEYIACMFIHQAIITTVLLHDAGSELRDAVPHIPGPEGWGEEGSCEAGVD